MRSGCSRGLGFLSASVAAQILTGTIIGTVRTRFSPLACEFGVGADPNRPDPRIRENDSGAVLVSVTVAAASHS